MHNALMCRYVTLCRNVFHPKCSSVDGIWTHLIMIPRSHISQRSKKTASRPVHTFLHSSPSHTDRHTDHATCDICRDRSPLCIAYRRCGLIMNAPNAPPRISGAKSSWNRPTRPLAVLSDTVTLTSHARCSVADDHQCCHLVNDFKLSAENQQ